MRQISEISLSALIVIVVGIFLVGQRLDARWAGGLGYVEPCPAILLDTPMQTIARGELMSSPADSPAKYQLCDGTLLYLDANTQIRLSEYRNPLASQNTQLELIQGRVIVDGLADVRARNAVVSLRGAGCELVHYSWRDELDVTPLVEAACQLVGSDALPLANSTTRYNTFTSSILENRPFTPESSAAQDFYRWTGLKFEGLR
jgi:hypothetical protein